MIFDLFLYATVTILVLAAYGSRNHGGSSLASIESPRDIAPAEAAQEAIAPAEPQCASIASPSGSRESDRTAATDAALVEAAQEAIAQYWRSHPTHNVVRFHRPMPALESLTIRQLRALVRERGLRIVGYGSLPKSRLIAAIRQAA